MQRFSEIAPPVLIATSEQPTCTSTAVVAAGRRGERPTRPASPADP